MTDEDRRNAAIEEELHKKTYFGYTFEVMMVGSKLAVYKMMSYARHVVVSGMAREERLSKRRFILRTIIEVLKELSTFAEKEGIDLRPLSLKQGYESLHEALKSEIHNYIDQPGYKKVIERFEEVHAVAYSDKVLLMKQAIPILDWPLLSRVLEPGYIPSTLEIAKLYRTSKGIDECVVSLDEIFDLHFVRPNQDGTCHIKWIHQFENVELIIFGVNLIEMFKWDKENDCRVIETLLTSFSDNVNSFYFRDTPFLLLIDDCSLFRNKMDSLPLTEVFPELIKWDIIGYDEFMDFIAEKFKELNHNKDRSNYMLHLEEFYIILPRIKGIMKDIYLKRLI